MKNRQVAATFNRGLIDKKATARQDVRRVSMSGDIYTNWMPRTMGPMTLRPGLEYHGVSSGAEVRKMPFEYGSADKAILEFTNGTMRVWDDGDTLVTRSAVSSTIQSDTFASLTGWVQDNDTGCSSTSVTFDGASHLQLVGSGYGSGRVFQGIPVAVADRNVEHELKIYVSRGPVLLRIGTAAGLTDIFPQAVLRTGSHSIAFTPGGNFYIDFSSSATYPILVKHCLMGTGGTLEIDTIWPDGAAIDNIRGHQVGDVVFCAAGGYKPQRIERRSNSSWSVVDYAPDDGPFMPENTDTIRMTPSDISGSITVTSSREYFTSDHVGALFKIDSQGQKVEATATGEDQWSDAIRVSGVDEGRDLTVIVDLSSGSGTVTLQRSVGDVGAWVDVNDYTASNTPNGVTYNDSLDNSIVYYRIGVKTGNFTSGSIDLTLEYASGAITGIFKVTAYTSETQVSAIVLKNLGGSDASEYWSEGYWSDAQLWPEAVAYWEGRMWWSGEGRTFATVSNTISTFDEEVDGDSGPINRETGPQNSNETKWMLALSRLIVGTEGAENSVRSNSFDEPVTPSNYNIKAGSTKGSADQSAVFEDDTGFFTGKTKDRVYELVYDASKYGFIARDVSLLTQELLSTGVERIAIQEYPDRRLHCVLSDGSVAILVRDEVEEVLCWCKLETDGEVTDVVVLSADPDAGYVEDRVYYTVKRTINGTARYHHEQMAELKDCVGGNINRQLDAYLVQSYSGTYTLTGLSHLEGETVKVWADGAYVGQFTVSGGLVPLTDPVDDVVVGLGYTAQWRGLPPVVRNDMGVTLLQPARVHNIGFILENTHCQGLKFGPDFSNLDNLPLVLDGVAVADDTIHSFLNQKQVTMAGRWGVDSTVCLQAEAPKPATVLAAVFDAEIFDEN